MANSTCREFWDRWLNNVVFFVVVALALVFSVLSTAIIFLPVVLGIYLEHGLMPYQILSLGENDTIPLVYWGVEVIWAFLTVTMGGAAMDTWGN